MYASSPSQQRLTYDTRSSKMRETSNAMDRKSSVLWIVSRITLWEYAPYGDTVGN